ncbi:hypothetical protein [Thauera humireducens]|uniref:hypothetical protein n=1 Tax=Thauera humireducens TaxID=1134435 RepID=UPI00311EE15A
MTPAEAATILRQFNEWRRGDEDIPQFDPCEIGEAIDAAIEMIDRLEAAEKERDALRAKIERMEKQEPVAIVDYKRGSCIRWVEYLGWQKIKDGTMLYALPGAQPAPSAPDGWRQHAARMAALARKLREPDWCLESIREMQRELYALEEAAIAAAAEAKP